MPGVGFGGGCTTANLPDCANVRPRVNVSPAEGFKLFFFINNASNVAWVDIAWDWDDSWCSACTEQDYRPCTTNTLSVSTPQDPGGPNSGRLFTFFDCITASFMSIGHIGFWAGSTGCLEFVEVNDTFGTNLVDCKGNRNEYDHTGLEAMRFGKICVESGGFDSCDPLPTPVQPATWGRIKQTYVR